MTASLSAPAPPSSSPLLRLPPELFDTLLSHIPADQLQRTALSLQQVFPDYPLSRRHLFTYLVVHRPEQVRALWLKLKEESRGVDGGMAKYVNTFSMESWRGDADLLNNALRCIPDAKVIMLNLGTNFAPDHLQEMFEEPRLDIRRIELRFRPYVEQASYYQFLAGSYFDTAIETMYQRWPEIQSFTHLSIIQDLPPRMTAPPTALASRIGTAANSETASALSSLANSVAELNLETSDDEPSDDSTPATSVESNQSPVEKGYTGHGPFPYLNDKMGWARPKTFAQPIVFFDIKCLARFGASPVAANLTHLRLRVPSRDVAYLLTTGSSASGKTINLFPSLRYLDISTTNLRLDSGLSTLLKSFDRLEHIVLDRVNLFGFAAKDRGVELSHELGSMCVSAGLARGKERERSITSWDVMQRTRLAQAEAERQRAQAQQQHDEDESRLSPEIIAAREAQAAAEERQRNIALARSRRGHRSAAQATFSLRDRPLRSSRASAGPLLPSNISVPPPDRAYFVLPPLPTLKTISVGGEAHALSAAKVAEWENDFHIGWKDGLGKVLGWAVHVSERYERAKKKAEEWFASESGPKHKEKERHGKAKGKPAAPGAKVKPPTDVRLFRFPRPDEVRPPTDPSDPTVGLIEIVPEGREFLEEYKLAIGDAELYATSHGNPAPCVFCTVPDCEGPARKGAEGERVDGRGGLGGRHKEGCGHMVGRNVWGWQNVDHL